MFLTPTWHAWVELESLLWVSTFNQPLALHLPADQLTGKQSGGVPPPKPAMLPAATVLQSTVVMARLMPFHGVEGALPQEREMPATSYRFQAVTSGRWHPMEDWALVSHHLRDLKTSFLG